MSTPKRNAPEHQTIERHETPQTPGIPDVQDLESRWQAAWERAGYGKAEAAPTGERYFVHDSTPFPNGALHLGHVRCYVLGDVTARYQRLLGKTVLYHTGFDSFGLPIELEAQTRGIAPRALVREAIATQTRQLKRLGISYDWSRIPDNSEPETYRWTQWLFLELHRAGLVELRDAPLNWCGTCQTTLARIQVEDGCCWRCSTPVETRQFPQWTVMISQYAPRLRKSLADLTEWSDHAKRALAAMLDDTPKVGVTRGQGGVDWLVSRQRSWGTPIPMVHCSACGPVPVPDDQLPVLLPDDLDWASGSGALARCQAFVETTCPSCSGPAKRETDTLDCSFDDSWCFFQSLVLDADPQGFTTENLRPWLPVDRAQAGRDTYTWFHLYRFIGLFLYERGLLERPDFLKSYLGHDMILSEGKKMSKHLGNAVSPNEILRTHGADVLRVAMMWAAGPQRNLYWQNETLEKSAHFLNGVYRLAVRLAELPATEQTAGGADLGPVPKKLQALVQASAREVTRVGGFIEDYRPNAGVEALANLLTRVEAFVTPRADSGRLGPDQVAPLRRVMDDITVALAPFAPHLAEEIWSLNGPRPLLALTAHT